MNTQPASLDRVFAALSDPTRRAILARLALGEASVAELMEPFALSQPAISKHLKVLGDAGLVETGRDAQRRPRRLNAAAMRDMDAWLEPFRRLWESRFDNLDRHLATMKKETCLPPVLDSIAPAGFTIDEASHTIRFARRFAAGRDQVFTAWTEPAHVAAWWDPAGEPLARCEIDLRVGGSFTFVSRGHEDRPFSGIYREIAPPARLVFDAMGAEGRVILAEAEDGTLMKVEIACSSAAHLEQFVAMGVAAGTSRTLDNLVAHLASAAR